MTAMMDDRRSVINFAYIGRVLFSSKVMQKGQAYNVNVTKDIIIYHLPFTITIHIPIH